MATIVGDEVGGQDPVVARKATQRHRSTQHDPEPFLGRGLSGQARRIPPTGGHRRYTRASVRAVLEEEPDGRRWP